MIKKTVQIICHKKMICEEESESSAQRTRSNSSKKYHVRGIDVNYRYHGKGKYIQPKKCSIKENPPQFWSEYANAVFVAQTGELL